MGSLEGFCQSQGCAGGHSDLFMGTFVLCVCFWGLDSFRLTAAHCLRAVCAELYSAAECQASRIEMTYSYGKLRQGATYKV